MKSNSSVFKNLPEFKYKILTKKKKYKKVFFNYDSNYTKKPSQEYTFSTHKFLE